jgi:hypothetical protein
MTSQNADGHINLGRPMVPDRDTSRVSRNQREILVVITARVS